MAQSNFFDQFDKPTAAQTAKQAAEARANAAEARAKASEARAAARELREAKEFEEKQRGITPPGDVTKTGEDYLKTIDPTLARQVKALAEGRRAFPTGFAMKSPDMQRLVAAATQYDPLLDAANAATRVATRKDFTSGKAALNMTSINTAIGHLATLRKAARGLNNRSLRGWNKIANLVATESGDPAVRNFQIARQAVASELTRAFRGTGGSLTEVKDWEAAISDADSPAQLEKAIGQATELLVSRLEAMQSQYQQGMGRSADAMQFLTPKNRETLDSLLVGGGVTEPGSETADVFQGPSKGNVIAPEDIKGWRLSPEAEASVLRYVQDPTSTPEGAAKLISDTAVSEGHIPPDQRDTYYANVLGSYSDYFNRVPPAQRRGGLDYSQIDKAATENAGLGASVAQAIRNVPESAAQLAQGILALPGSAIASAASGELQGATKGVVDLASEMGSGPTTEAFKDVMAERYGGAEELKRTAIRDPLGLAGDISIPLTLGGSALARAPGTVGNFGRAVSTAGRVIDPLSGTVALATEGLPAILSGLRQRYPGAFDGAGRTASEIAGGPSGVGGPALREGFSAGVERGRAGAPTARSQAFTENMRQPDNLGDDLVARARDAVQNLRNAASQQYQAAMAQFGRNPSPIPIDNVIQRVDRLRPRNFDAMVDAPNRPTSHRSWETLRDTVQDYAAKARQDPSLLEPLAVDAFKQDLYEIGSKVGGAYDRDAARMAGTAYNAVRDELVRHDPVYARTMRDYERAAREAQQLEGTFSLATARGKQVNVDTATRKLLSIMRNNANTNYGSRAARGARLADLDQTGTIMPTLAGQTASSIRPRGLQSLGATLTAAGAVLTNPLALPAMAAFSPRVMGEASYGLGRAVGTGQRAAASLSQTAAPVSSRIADLYNRYPAAALATSQAGNRMEDLEDELRRKYGIGGDAPMPSYEGEY